ncbi:MAG: hypothetical protein QXP78_05715 [Candidatus Bathyarchaeia archaeon]
MKILRFLEFLNKKSLILGEIKTGKTKFTAELLKEAIDLGFSSKITVIDLAPKTKTLNGEFIGLPITNYVNIDSKIVYVRAEVKAPRIEGKNKEEVLKIAEENATVINEVFNNFLKSNDREILFINDVSLYLHKGDLNKLFSVLSKVNTAILNGYYGKLLNNDLNSGISLREKSLMVKLAELMDLIFEMKNFKLLKINVGDLI